MINNILYLDPFPSTFSIISEKAKFIEYGGKLPKYFDDINEISKADVIKLIREGKHSKKVELLAILFWGIYFRVMARNPKTVKSLVAFMDGVSIEDEMKKRTDAIIDSENPETLFNSFDTKSKVPGLDYAYFTKLFFFYREALVPKKQTYLILDKWLSHAWCAIDGSLNNNIDVFKDYYCPASKLWFNGRLLRQIPTAYAKYLDFMDELRIKVNKEIQINNQLSLIDLEEKLFGADLKNYPSNNPRELYKNWARQNSIPLKKLDSEKSENALRNQNPLEESPKKLYLGERQSYTGLYINPKSSNKMGYIDDNGWLCASAKLKMLLEPYNLHWDNGNTKAGPEKFKTKFETKEKCIQFLKNVGIVE